MILYCSRSSGPSWGRSTSPCYLEANAVQTIVVTLAMDFFPGPGVTKAMYHLRLFLFLDETRLPVHRSFHPDPKLELDLDLGSRARALLDVSLDRIRPLSYRRLGPGAGASARAACARTQIRRAQRTVAAFRTDGEADGLRGRVSVPCHVSTPKTSKRT